MNYTDFIHTKNHFFIRLFVNLFPFIIIKSKKILFKKDPKCPSSVKVLISVLSKKYGFKNNALDPGGEGGGIPSIPFFLTAKP